MSKALLKFFAAIIPTLALMAFLSGKINIPNNPLPPLANFLSPIHGIWANGVPIPKKSITVNTSELKEEANIYYDERWVPHIFANNTEDALYLQGYVEASNRLFQMDFMTRAASSRLSEVLGDKTKSIDLNRHLTGLERGAEITAEDWSKTPQYPMVEAYVRGVNSYIASLSPKDYPMEYKLLDFKPEPWTVKKTALIFKYMSEVLANGCNDLEATNMLTLLGRETFDLLYPENEDGGYPVIPYEKKYDAMELVGNPNKKDSIVKEVYKNTYFDKTPKGIGSNNWAVGGSKTLSKMPILSNDPHLTLNFPSIWFEEQISTPEYTAYGVSFPGFPGIMIGFNQNIAWGETNVGQDVQDLYQIHYTDASRTKYLLDGKTMDIEYHIQEIKVKGQASIIDTVKYTAYGPVIKQSVDGLHDLTRHWLPLHSNPEPEFMTFVNAMKCKNYDEYLTATSVFCSPAQNFLCASNKDEIGIRVNGKLPIRYNEDGRFIETGNSISQDWEGIIPRDQNPQIKNPKQGYVTSTNQKSAGNDYPYYYTGNFEHYRNISINEKLSAMDSITPEDMKQLQGNSESSKAKAFLPLMLASISDKDDIYQKLTAWNYEYKADQLAPVYFEEWQRAIDRLTFDEVYQYKDSMAILYPEESTLISLMKNKCDNDIFDIKSTPEKESCKDIIQLAYHEMKLKVSKNPTQTWGKFKPLSIYHYTRIPAFSALDLEVDGCPDAINAVNRTFGPSWRMVVQLGLKPEAWGVYPGGQSGNPASPYYRNMLQTWVDKKHDKLNYALSAEEIKASQVIQFKK